MILNRFYPANWHTAVPLPIRGLFPSVLFCFRFFVFPCAHHLPISVTFLQCAFSFIEFPLFLFARAPPPYQVSQRGRWQSAFFFALLSHHWPLHSVRCTLYNVHWTLYTDHCTVLTTHHCTLYNVHTVQYSTVYTEHWTLYIAHCTLHAVHTIYTSHCKPHTNVPVKYKVSPGHKPLDTEHLSHHCTLNTAH